jgi:DNA-directed RNA polymerase specialized sigma24 family protein
MEGGRRSTLRLSLRAAACTLAGDVRDPVASTRVRSAVDAQLRRAGVEAQDADDVRTEVALALLCAPAAELALPLELVCARAAAIARNKAIDHGRRRSRAPLALGDDLPEPLDVGVRPGSLADGLDDVVAAAHRRRVRADLVLALARLDAPQRAAIGAHADGGAARAAGLPRSTYYRVLANAQARLSGDLRGRLTGVGALGGVAQRARELFQHVEAAHAAAAAATAAVAVTAAVVLSVHDEHAHPLPAPVAAVAAVAAGGRVAVAPAAVVRAAPATRPLRQPATTATPAPAGATAHATAAAATPAPSTCTYDPSAYDC